jgi:phosphoglycolate phosphatase
LKERHLIVFDLDGTLVDSLPAIAAGINSLRSRRGLTALPAAEVGRMSGGPMHGLLRRSLAEAIGIDFATDRDLEAEYSIAYRGACSAGVIRPFAGATELLERASAAGFLLAICTNKSRELALVTTDAMGWQSWFSDWNVIGCDTLDRVKPDPLPIQVIMKRTGMSADHCWMVGDSAVDMALARASGVRSIAVGFGYGSAVQSMPNHAVESFEELAQVLGLESLG